MNDISPTNGKKKVSEDFLTLRFRIPLVKFIRGYPEHAPENDAVKELAMVRVQSGFYHIR
jgi:hypothetical protein